MTMRSVMSLVNRKIIMDIRGGRSMEARRNFCSTPESSRDIELFGRRLIVGWCVGRGIGMSVGYGLAGYFFADFVPTRVKNMEKRHKWKKETYELTEKRYYKLKEEMLSRSKS